jgi:adenylate cyclase class 2
MIEIEMKFPLADFAPLERALAQWGAREAPPAVNADHYFNAPDRDFAVTDEALRLRRIGTTNRLTYKGPKHAALAKIRTEIEVGVAEGEEAANDFIRLLTHLGYRPVAVVRKHRRTFHLNREGYDLEVTLDEVEGLGRFAEVEILAPEEGVQGAGAALQRVAGELGLGASQRRSYLEMLLEKKGEKTA